MAVVYTDIQAMAPEFATVSQTKIEACITKASLRCNSGFFGALHDSALTLLAAHILACELAGSAGPGGAVVSKTAGPLSVTYAAPAWSPTWFNATTWGREYQHLARTLAGPRAI
jgi:hypothetical protein